MPSASNNQNNNNVKLEKRVAVNAVQFGSTGGGGSGPGGGGASTAAGSLSAISNSTTTNINAANVVAAGTGAATAAGTATATNSNLGVDSTTSVSISNCSTNMNTNSNAIITTTTTNNNNNNANIANDSTSNANAAGGGGGACSVSGTNSATNIANDPNPNTPVKQALTIIEHKIRNLEKRKTKLESYRAIQANGKELSADQKQAVAKYESVMGTLEFARDLSKQIMQISKEADKEHKKQTRKENIAKAHAETAKIREVLVIQNILGCFRDEAVRADFLAGDNSAIKLESNDMNVLEKFSIDTNVRRPETSEDIAFVSGAQKAAEYFSMTIDGRPKQYGETTFENLRRIFNQVQDCGYLDKIYMTVTEPGAEANEDANSGLSGVIGESDTTAATSDENLLQAKLSKLNLAADYEEGACMISTPPPLTTMMPGDANVLLQAQMKPHDLQSHQRQQQQQPKEQRERKSAQQHVVLAPGGGVSGMQVGVSNYPGRPSSRSSATPVPLGMYPTQQMQQQTAAQLQQMTAGGIMKVTQQQAGGGVGPASQMPQVIGGQAVVKPPSQQQRGGGSGGGGGIVTNPSVIGAQLTNMPLHSATQAGLFPPTTVRAVEQSFFKQQQFLQQMRPLAEVISGGSFYFLQDSELDSPDMLGGGGGGQLSSIIFEQQLQQSNKPPQMQQMQQQQLQPPDILKSLELQKTPDKKLQQKSQSQQFGAAQQQTPPQLIQPTPIKASAIPTQTFTNQSFPPVPPALQSPSAVQSVTGTPPGVALANTTPTSLISNASSPMFQQQLFSPVAVGSVLQQPLTQQQHTHHQQQMLQQQQQHLRAEDIVSKEQLQQQPAAMMILSHLAAPQARLPPQQQQHVPIGMQPGDAANSAARVVGAGAFSFDDPLVQSLTSSYEQQLKAAVAAETVVGGTAIGGKKSPHDLRKFVSETEWPSSLKPGARSNASAATAVLANVLKNAGAGGGSSSGGASIIESNKWGPTTAGADINASAAVGVSGGGGSSGSGAVGGGNQLRKNDWAAAAAAGANSGNSGTSSGGGGGGFGDSVSHESNHWNTQPADSTGYGRSGGVRGGYQRRTDERRERDDRRDERSNAGGRAAAGGSNAGTSYRARASNYSSAAAQNGARGNGNGSGSSMFFRNNESGSSSFYQNGSGGNGGNSVFGGSKDGGGRFDAGGGGGGGNGGSYRGPRGNSATITRSSAPSQRSIGRSIGAGSGGNGGNGNGSGNGGGSGSGGASSYINPTRSANRLSLGLDSKN